MFLLVVFYEFNFQLLGILNAAYLVRLKENFICSASVSSNLILIVHKRNIFRIFFCLSQCAGGFSVKTNIFRLNPERRVCLQFFRPGLDSSVLNKLCFVIGSNKCSPSSAEACRMIENDIPISAGAADHNLRAYKEQAEATNDSVQHHHRNFHL